MRNNNNNLPLRKTMCYVSYAKVTALKTIGSELKSMKVTKAGYNRCKAALKTLGLTWSEQIDALLWLEFRNQLIDDKEYNVNEMLASRWDKK